MYIKYNNNKKIELHYYNNINKYFNINNNS